MKTVRLSTASRRRLGYLVTTALALGTVSASALSVSTADATTTKVTIAATTEGNMGKVLTSKGAPLYVLSHNKSACSGTCLKIWPAVTLPAHVNSAAAGQGVQHSKLGTASGPHGLRQVTYNGHRLYTFVGDNAKGKVKGDITDQWGKWTAVVVAKAPSSSGSSSTSTTSGGSSAGSGGASF